jgi:hypothetical protein
MGWRYVQHDSMCGCERCAREWERESPQPIFERVADPSYDDFGRRLGDEPDDDWDAE